MSYSTSSSSSSMSISSSNTSYSSQSSSYDQSITMLSAEELNAAALDSFVYTPVDRKMIRHLARRTNQVISCDAAGNELPAATPETGVLDEGPIPTLEEFITQLVVCSNVQVPTLMSTLVYLTRLKARLQPQAKGRRSTPHRIFLATLILAAKYLNDSSPKNRHWARYTALAVSDPRSASGRGDFRFRTAEVNEMERQLLYLLDFELRIQPEDLYRDLEPFLAPIAEDIARDYAARQRRKQEARMRSQQSIVSAPAPVAVAAPAVEYSNVSVEDVSMSSSPAASSEDSPYAPSLAYSSSSMSTSGDSPASSMSSRATTPEEENGPREPYVYCQEVDGSYQEIDFVEQPSQMVKQAPVDITKKTIRERIAGVFHHNRY